MDTNIDEIKLLAVVGSPRKKGSSEYLLSQAMEGAQATGPVETRMFHFGMKKVAACNGCFKCTESGECIIPDDFSEFFAFWLWADAIIYSIPVYHMLPPAQLISAIDRLGNVMYAYLNKKLPRFLKVGGIIAQGSSRFGGQQIAIQWLAEHLIINNCLVVSGDTPESYLGVSGYAPTWEKGSIKSDKIAIQASKILGQRIAETARIILAGKKALPQLPPEYFFKYKHTLKTNTPSS